jgi:hypothetical protein
MDPKQYLNPTVEMLVEHRAENSTIGKRDAVEQFFFALQANQHQDTGLLQFVSPVRIVYKYLPTLSKSKSILFHTGQGFKSYLLP